MSGTCDDCHYAEWKLTVTGRKHPDKTGRCGYLKAHPLDLRIPAAFSWPGWGRAPEPAGGFIERGMTTGHGRCAFKQAASPSPKEDGHGR